MRETRAAKLFKNGASQAVRLPADFKFEGSEVFATRDDQTGDVVLSARPGVQAWSDFFELVNTIEDSEAYLSDRPMNAKSVEKTLFEDD